MCCGIRAAGIGGGALIFLIDAERSALGIVLLLACGADGGGDGVAACGGVADG